MSAAAQEAPLLQVQDLDAGYGAVQVLWEVSLDVRPGETVALIGPNGAGKSTLLRTISGLGRPWRGQVRFGGREITARICSSAPMREMTRPASPATSRMCSTSFPRSAIASP